MDPVTRELLQQAADRLQDQADAGYNDPLAMMIYKHLEHTTHGGSNPATPPQRGKGG